MRLVDADALKEKAFGKRGGLIHTSDIDAAPTVDAVPVVHGRWKEDPSGYGFWICSHCGFVSEASGADILYRYCPHCGALMDGKDGEQHGTDIR